MAIQLRHRRPVAETVRRLVPWRAVVRRDASVEHLLAGLESDGYAVLHDVETAGGTVDHVVIGPSGVFLLDTRAWRGNVYQATRGRLMCDGRDRSAAIDQAIAEAAAIKQYLEPIGTGRVDAILAVREARIRRPMTFRRVRVTSVRDAVELIRNGPPRLSRDEIVRAGSHLARWVRAPFRSTR